MSTLLIIRKVLRQDGVTLQNLCTLYDVASEYKSETSKQHWWIAVMVPEQFYYHNIQITQQITQWYLIVNLQVLQYGLIFTNPWMNDSMY